MSSNESDINQWTDPRDYGLPFVKIIPISSKEVQNTDAADQKEIAAAETLKDSSTELVERGTPTQSAVATSMPTTVSDTKKTTSSVTTVDSTTKKSTGWVWAVLGLGLIIVAVIVWQIRKSNVVTEAIPAFEVIEKPTEKVAVDAESAGSQSADQNQEAVNQEPNSTAGNSDPNISKPAESGTTIANTGTGNLIRVEAKADRPQYFIIVGSLPNEGLALKEANQYLGRTPELYLISPMDGGKNYRLALSKFDTFKAAAAKLEEIKSQYTEELWILKY
jgi:hypothetical protein